MRVGSLVAAVILCGAVAPPAAAQSFGAKAGVAFSDISIETFDLTTRAEAGAVVGGFVRFGLTSRTSLQLEALFAERKVTVEETARDEVNYFEVPVLGRGRVLTFGNNRVSAVGGAVLAFRLDAKEKFAGQSADISAAIEPFDLSVSVGADVEVGRRLVFDVRYLFGMSDVYTAADATAKYRIIQVTAGYRFR